MGRTKGSRNGYSTTPGYVAIGEKAQQQVQTVGNNLANHFAPAVNTFKKKLTTKEQNPAMPAATAKYLDKQKAAKEKAMEPQVQQQPQPQQPAPQQQTPPQTTAEKKNILQNLASMIPNQNGNQKNETATEQPKAKESTAEEKPKATKKKTFNLSDAMSAGKQLVNAAVQTVDKVAEKTGAKKAVIGGVGSKMIKDTAKDSAKKALNKAIPTYEGRKASNNEYFDDFVSNDLEDRGNDLKKKGKEYLNNSLARALDDPRIQQDLKDLANTGYKDQNAAVQQLANKLMDSGEVRKYSSVAADALVPTYSGRKASDKNKFGDFIKADIQDRINDAKKKGKEKAVNKMTSTVSKLTKDERLKGEMDSFKKDPVGTVQKIVDSAKNDPATAKKYKEIAADIAVPTYKERKATNDDGLFDFIMNDVQDRVNDAKKKAKKKFING